MFSQRWVSSILSAQWSVDETSTYWSSSERWHWKVQLFSTFWDRVAGLHVHDTWTSAKFNTHGFAFRLAGGRLAIRSLSPVLLNMIAGKATLPPVYRGHKFRRGPRHDASEMCPIHAAMRPVQLTLISAISRVLCFMYKPVWMLRLDPTFFLFVRRPYGHPTSHVPHPVWMRC